MPDKKDEVSKQFTLEEWATGMYGDSSTIKPSTTCNHDWKLYQGLLHDDYHCTICGETRPLNPQR